MTSSYTEMPLGNLLDFLNGKEVEFDEAGDFPVYGSNGVIGLSKKNNYEDAIILGRVGAYCGSVARCRGKFWSSDNTIVAYPKDGCDKDFAYFLLLNTPLNQFAGGAAQPLITHKILKPILVPVPDLARQKKIANILLPYDDLIENNRRRITLLEEAARQLYQEWFARLRFPAHERAEVVDSIPNGWEPKYLGEICEDIRDAVNPDQLEPGTPYIGLEHMPRRSISLGEWGLSDEVVSTKLRFKAGEIIFGKIRPYFHKVGIAFADGVASSDAIIIRPFSSELHAFTLLTVSSDQFIAMTSKTMKEGSKMPRADWKHMKSFKIAIPPAPLLALFNEMITPIIDQLKVLNLQNRKLKEARDLLLPRLMSGEITV